MLRARVPAVCLPALTSACSLTWPPPVSAGITAPFAHHLLFAPPPPSPLGSTALHFVRCIKPNSRQEAGQFDAGLVLHQLRCCGVLEVARIAQAGYPTRYLHHEFAARYRDLLPDKGAGGREAAEAGGCAGWLPSLCRLRPLPGFMCPDGTEACCLFPCLGTCVFLMKRLPIVLLPSAGQEADSLEVCSQLLAHFKVDPSQYQIGRTRRAGRAARKRRLFGMHASGLAMLCGSRTPRRTRAGPFLQAVLSGGGAWSAGGCSDAHATVSWPAAPCLPAMLFSCLPCSCRAYVAVVHVL